MPLRHHLSRRARVLAACHCAAGVLAFSNLASAQHANCVNPIEIWVDQEIGSNVTGTGSPSNPFQSITFALTQTPANCNKVVIIVNPGIYDVNAVVPEVFPLVMKRNVSIQGTNALNTVIRGEDTCDDNLTPLILFNAVQTGDFDTTFIDALNIHKGCVGVRITGDVPSSPTISNCFLTDSPKTGVDIVSNGTIHRPKVIHCTFAQNRVSLINRSSADGLGLPGGPVPPITVPPPSRPGLLNVLSSHTSSGVDFFGIRFDAMQGNSPNGFFFESSSGLANASGAALSGNQASGFGFTPGVSSTLLYVEEVAFGFLGAASDLRINPGFQDDNGSGTPIDTAHFGGGGLITWLNGTTGKYGFLNNGTIGDWDCEGYGNKRLENGTPDMGADEVGNYVLARYTSYTTNWGNNMIEWKGFAFGTPSGRYHFTLQAVPFPSQRYVDSGLTPPGNRAVATSLPTASTEPGVSGTFYIPAHSHLPYSVTGPQPTPVAKPAVAQRTLFNVQIDVPNLPNATMSNLQAVVVFP